MTGLTTPDIPECLIGELKSCLGVCVLDCEINAADFCLALCVYFGMFGYQVISDQEEHTSFVSVLPVFSVGLISSHKESHVVSEVCLLDNGYVDLLFVESVCQWTFLPGNTLCIPLHHCQQLRLLPAYVVAVAFTRVTLRLAPP